VQTIVGILGSPSYLVINFKVEPITNTMLAPATIPYISKARILRVILLLLVELQWIRFPLILNSSCPVVSLAIIILYLI
jgi:hypothetical protein